MFKNLTPTRQELEGWLNRGKMHDFNGRSSKPQMALARHYGFEDYAQPAGGCCFLTYRQYSRKLADLWETRGERNYELDDIMLLKVRRHLRPRLSCGGPLVLLDGEAGPDDLKLAVRIAARFSKCRNAAKDTMEEIVKNDASRNYQITRLPSGQISSEWCLLAARLLMPDICSALGP